MRKTAHTIKDIYAARKHIREFSRELSERCGKAPGSIEKDILRAKKVNHISLNEYEWTGYYDLSEAQKATVSTLWTRAEYRKTFTDRRYICILMNKYIFSKVFSDFYGRGCAMTRDVTPEKLRELAGDKGKVVLKPNCKGQGKGVRVLSTATEEEFSAALEQIGKVENGIVDEYIVQHPDIARLNPDAVSIVRFYSVTGPEASYLFAPVFTAATNKDISNGCQDALTAMIDIRTGEVISDAVDQNNISDYPVHPVTGVPFKGLKLPFWQETIDMMRKAVPLADKISNIGWDVAITEEGPLIIEANTIPGFNTAQYRGFAWVTEGFGYQPLFDEGLKGIPFDGQGHYDRVLIKL